MSRWCLSDEEAERGRAAATYYIFELCRGGACRTKRQNAEEQPRHITDSKYVAVVPVEQPRHEVAWILDSAELQQAPKPRHITNLIYVAVVPTEQPRHEAAPVLENEAERVSRQEY